MPGKLDFYAIVLFLHIAAAVIGFGALFAFPLVSAAVRRGDPRSLPAWHEAQIQIARKLFTPGATLVLVTGVYLAIDRWRDTGPWFSIAGVIVVVVLGLAHGYLIPRARRLRDQARQDTAGGDGQGARLSEAYDALAASTAKVGALNGLLILIALLLMVWKPGA